MLAILILLTIGLAAEVNAGFAALSTTGWTLAGAWLGVSLLSHLAGWRARSANLARLWGARVAHGGAAIAIGGILLSSLFTSSIQRSLAPGETLRFNAWTAELHDVWPAAGEGWAGVKAELRASNGGGVIVLEPQQQFHSETLVRSKPASLRSGGGLLIASFGPRDAEGRWPIRLSWTPMVVLVLIGLVITALGCAAVMVGPGIARRRRLRRARLATAWWA